MYLIPRHFLNIVVLYEMTRPVFSFRNLHVIWLVCMDTAPDLILFLTWVLLIFVSFFLIMSKSSPDANILDWHVNFIIAQTQGCITFCFILKKRMYYFYILKFIYLVYVSQMFSFFSFLWQMFHVSSRFMNQYFLLIACLQLWPLITPVNPASTWGPLIFIFAVSATKEAWDDYNRYLCDKKANEKEVWVVRHGIKKHVRKQKFSWFSSFGAPITFCFSKFGRIFNFISCQIIKWLIYQVLDLIFCNVSKFTG